MRFGLESRVISTLSSIRFWILLVLVIGIGVFLRSQHMTDIQSRSPDERIYTYRASRIVNEGLDAYPELFKAFDGDPQQWIYPSPIRFGHELLFAGMMKLTGVQDTRAGAATSWLFSLFSGLLLARLGLRFFNPWVALLSVAFLTFSVGDLGMARRAWQDTTFGFLSLLLIYLTCEITREPRRKLWHVAFAAVAACCLLTKETAVVSCGLCGMWLSGVMIFRERSWKLLGLIVLEGWVAAGASFGVWAVLAGDAGLAYSSMAHSFRNGSGPYGQMYFSGPWHQFLYLLWIVGPLTAAMAVTGLIVAALAPLQPLRELVSIREPQAGVAAALVTAGFVAFASFGPNLHYLRIMSPVNGTYCLLAGLGLWALLCRARRMLSGSQYRVVVAMAVISLAAAAARDYRVFTQVVVGSGMEELGVSGIRFVMGR